MLKKVSPAVALTALALLISSAPAWREASAQEVAAARPGARTTRAHGGGAARLLKRMTLSVTDSAEGTRARLTSDASLEGFRTFTEGGRFYVLVPEADAAVLATGGTTASGFSRVEAGQRGDDAVIAFTLNAGVAPRVRASFNRLEIFFAAQPGQQPASGGSQPAPADAAAAAATPTPTPAAPTANSTAGGPSPATATAPGAPAGTKAARLAALRTPEKMTPATVTRFDAPPVIDGRLDDEVWKNASVFKDFVQYRPVDLVAPSHPTEVRIGYDSRFLYVAFRAYDEPGKVRATVAKRDAVFDDDWVGIWLDTFNDGRRAYELIFNPLGVQADAVFTEGISEDFSVDIVMESKGVLLQDGYAVEVAIPFKSLRYEAGKGKRWGLQLMRTIKRLNNEQSTWMPISKDNSSLLGQSGHFTGLEGISTERTIEIIPSLTISQEGRRTPTITSAQRAFAQARGNKLPNDPGRFLNEPVGLDPGVSVKLGVTPTMTLDFTYNPDFAQVEADATVVTANQRFPIFFEEKRPFFLEGKEIFETLLSAVHTRSIVDPDYAFKFTGKRGRNTFGVMLASDNAPGNLGEDDRDFVRATNNLSAVEDPRLRAQLQSRRDSILSVLDKNATVGVLRLKRDVGKEGHVGFLATTSNFVDKYNHVAGGDVRYRLNKQTVFWAQALGSVSHRPTFYAEEAGTFDRKENGLAYAYNIDSSGRNWGWTYSAVGRSRFFRADVGFDRRRNTNNQNLFFRYQSNEKPKARVVSWRFFNAANVSFDWSLRSQNYLNESQFQIRMQKQTFLGVGYQEAYERVFESEFGSTRDALARVAVNTFGPGLASRHPACDPTGGMAPVIPDDEATPGVDEARFLRRCTFFGADPERSAPRRDVYFYAETVPSKKFSVFLFTIYRMGALDFDFGTENPDFTRVSPAALAFGQDAPLDPGPGNELTVEASANYQPTDELRLSLGYNKQRLTRRDTGLVAFDDNIYTLRGTYQFTRFWFARARMDYTSLGRRARGQFLLGWTPNPGTTFYVGYNDDMNRNGLNPFSGDLEPGLRRNGRLFFIKMSYLIRRSFGE